MHYKYWLRGKLQNKGVAVLFIVLSMLLCLSGCGCSASPARSTEEEMYEPHIHIENPFRALEDIDPRDNPRWAHVQVERVWDGLFPETYGDGFERIYTVAECLVLEVLYDRRVSTEVKDYPRDGERCYIWFYTGTDTEIHKAFRQMLESTDSLLVYASGRMQSGIFIEDDTTENGRLLRTEYAATSDGGDIISPVMFLQSVAAGKLIPFINGKIDIVMYEECFGDKMYDGWGWFKAGTDIETALASARELVQKQLSE